MEMKRFADPDKKWVCGACGRVSQHDRYKMGDTSCVLRAIEVPKDAKIEYRELPQK